MFEFNTSFSVNTGVLGSSYTGSGVHLSKDVTFQFQLIDPQENLVQSDSQLLRNPLINNIAFDVLNSTGGLVYANYKSGSTSRTLTITAIENESIFGSYTKDFGIRASISNTINANIFRAEFYAYGNLPSIASHSIAGETYGDLSGPSYDKIDVNIQFNNNLKYVDINRFDVYASTGNDIALSSTDEANPNNNPSYLYTQRTQNINQVIGLSIKPVTLSYNTDYYFAIAPYSALGSGAAIYFGPHRFNKYTSGTSRVVTSANQFELFNGTESVAIDIITGSLANGNVGIFDSIESGVYSTVLYTAQVTTPIGYRISSELKLVVNSGVLTLLEAPINNTGQLSYLTDQSGIYTNIILSGLGMSGASFKASRTLF